MHAQHMSRGEDLSALKTIVRLPDGTSVTMRPIRREDAAAEWEFAHRLSAHSKYLRLMVPMNDLPADMLARLTDIDYEREMALVALVDTPEGERQIGVARYAMLDDGTTCEFAIIVSDEWQGKGVAYLLMHRLIEIARARGFRTMVGIALSENERIGTLARRLGFDIERDPNDAQLVRLTLSLV